MTCESRRLGAVRTVYNLNNKVVFLKTSECSVRCIWICGLTVKTKHGRGCLLLPSSPDSDVSVSTRPVSLHPSLRPAAGVRGEEPRCVHDSDAAGAEDEEGLDAHGTTAVGTLWSR